MNNLFYLSNLDIVIEFKKNEDLHTKSRKLTKPQ